MNKDKIHYNSCKVDSYNKAFNFIISARTAGKTTAIILKVYKKFRKDKQPSIILRRLINDVTESYISGIEEVINLFNAPNKQVKLQYKKGNIRDGVTDIFINNVLFLRIIALSNPMSRIKSSIIRNPAFIVFDEFICNLRAGEKYLTNEVFRFKEIYNTYRREAIKNGHELKAYFLGNPYSVYNPYFSDFKIDTLKLKQGAFLVGVNYVVDVYKLRAELVEKLKNNPLYANDLDIYTQYAFNGAAVNDTNIRLQPKQPDGYFIKYIFKIEGRYLVAYKDARKRNYIGCDAGRYWVAVKDNIDTSKKIYAVDFDNLEAGAVLLDVETEAFFLRLRLAVGRREVSYNSVEASYLTESIFTRL